ncbi:MAG: murein transglycosylase domain-containing protein [Desulfosudaceae bacterium]
MKHRFIPPRPVMAMAAALCLISLLPMAAADTPSAGGDPVNDVEALQQQFEQYNQQIQQDYQTEAGNIEEAYQKYQQMIEEEYRAYERRILAVWLEAEISTKKRWVEYSDDMKTRQVVDFDSGEIRIDMVLPEGATDQAEAMFQEKLRQLIQESQQTAYSRDDLAQRIEERLKELDEYVKTAPVPETPIMTRVVTGKSDPSPAEIRQAATDLRQRASVSRRPARDDNSRVVSFRTSLPPASIQRKALDYKNDVSRFAGQHGLQEPLVFAIMHTESAFNPMARSHVPAYGLMQIVPRSGGRDASKLIFGEEKLLSPSFLYNETNNINTGTAYLHLLYYRYLKAVADPTSRIYCAISAYNTGPGNVARAFTGSTNVARAAAVINRMTPDQVYHHLQRNLPYQETRHYLQRVVQRMDTYHSL